ncbi:site-specific integrase [Paractinoplanes hotanensis]|uniref:Site-specific integrase n=1 Tax=Paractinoplanes hotanensis TaxID=2906497 RepID=A0ABT0YDR1_9ACTN|nr:site-specific integrase [Actinoplanes hotanensis]MCM4083925.1 site-specific integrase [Actinoplanes hotanensis]
MVAKVGSVQETGNVWEPYRLSDPAGIAVAAVTAFLNELQASGRSAATQRSYAMDLLRWFRFLWAVGVLWSQATRVEARDFCRWLVLCDKQSPGGKARPVGAGAGGVRNPVTGKPSLARTYAPTTRAHGETVVRGFYAFHQEVGSGPMVNPFPLVGERRGSRAHAHHNPMEPWQRERSGRYRPKLVARVPRCIPDERFNQFVRRAGFTP